MFFHSGKSRFFAWILWTDYKRATMSKTTLNIKKNYPLKNRTKYIFLEKLDNKFSIAYHN